MPKGVNFLSFGKGSVCSFKRSIQSTAQEMILKLPQSVNFGRSSEEKKDWSNKWLNDLITIFFPISFSIISSLQCLFNHFS